MQRTASEEHARRNDRDARQKVKLESSERQQKFACRREEEHSSGDAIPAIDSAKGKECNDTPLGRCTALLVKERGQNGRYGRRLTAQQRQQRRSSGVVHAAAGEIGYQNILGSSDCVCAVSRTDLG